MKRDRIEVRWSLIVVLLASLTACSSSAGDAADGGVDGARADLGQPPDRGAPADVFVGDVDPAALTLQGFPESMRSYAGANALLLAELRGNRGFDLDLMLTSNPEKLPLKLYTIDDGDRTLFEVLLVPRADHVGQTVTVTLSLADQRRGVVREATMAVKVVTDTAPPEPPAGLRARFVAYLAASQAALGIDEATEWDSLAGIVGPPDAAGTQQHWIYSNPQWELGLSWSTEPAPDDSASIYLRRRSELLPSFAARLPSRADPGAPIAEQPPPAEPIR